MRLIAIEQKLGTDIEVGSVTLVMACVTEELAGTMNELGDALGWSALARVNVTEDPVEFVTVVWNVQTPKRQCAKKPTPGPTLKLMPGGGEPQPEKSAKPPLDLKLNHSLRELTGT